MTTINAIVRFPRKNRNDSESIICKSLAPITGIHLFQKAEVRASSHANNLFTSHVAFLHSVNTFRALCTRSCHEMLMKSRKFENAKWVKKYAWIASHFRGRKKNANWHAKLQVLLISTAWKLPSTARRLFTAVKKLMHVELTVVSCIITGCFAAMGGGGRGGDKFSNLLVTCEKTACDDHIAWHLRTHATN